MTQVEYATIMQATHQQTPTHPTPTHTTHPHHLPQPLMSKPTHLSPSQKPSRCCSGLPQQAFDTKYDPKSAAAKELWSNFLSYVDLDEGGDVGRHEFVQFMVSGPPRVKITLPSLCLLLRLRGDGGGERKQRKEDLF